MKLAILFGGASYEHEISIVSAVTMKEKLTEFELSFIFCDQDHTFYLIDSDNMTAKTFASGSYKQSPVLNLEKKGFVSRKLFSSTTLDMPVLNLIHGADGEDGTIASLLDFYGIHYIGPRTDASVLSFDKIFTKWMAESVGIRTVSYEVLASHDERVVKTTYPFIIKPARLGSSIGVSIVHSEEELDYALDVAFEFDTTVLIEPFYQNVKEFNLAGFKGNEGIIYSIVEEPKKNEFLDFEKKYLDFSRTGEVGEADIDEGLKQSMQAAFDAVYTNRFEGALIRCDFFVIDNEVYLNEVNPIPGSMANYLFSDFQAAIRELLDNLPKRRLPRVKYEYIHSIHAAKGK